MEKKGVVDQSNATWNHVFNWLDLVEQRSSLAPCFARAA